MHSAHIPPHCIMRNLVKQAGSYHKLGFLKQDLKDHVKKIKKEKERDGDAKVVMGYLKGEKTC